MTDSEYKVWVERWGGWVLVSVLCLIPIIRWLFVAPLGERFVGGYSTLTSLGRLAGLLGFMLFAINLLLSIRKRWLENFFGGLNRVYIAHHILGGVAFVLILFHPLFLALRYIEFNSLVTVKDAAHFLLPRSLHFNGTFNDVMQATAINNGIIAFVGLVGLLFITFFVKLPYRVWLLTHKFLGLTFLFVGAHVLFVTSDVANDLFLRLYIALWITIGLTAYVYRTLLGNIFVRRAPYRVVEVKHLSHDVVTMALLPIGPPIDFQPGQFVFIRFLWAGQDGISKEAHPFSIASPPHSEGLRLYTKGLGDFTKGLASLQRGTIAEIEGAFGRFLPLRFVDKEQIWIAGGIGITPFIATARSFTDASPPVTLFYSVVHKEELLDTDALAHFLPSTFPQFKYVPFVSDIEKTHLSATKVAEIVGDVRGKDIFICGPPAMMKALRVQFKAMGVLNRNIHTEEFSIS